MSAPSERRLTGARAATAAHPDNRTRQETEMTAWHNSPDLKAEVVARMRAHREADEFIQGTYQLIDPHTASGYRGCAIGCTLPIAEHFAYGWHRAVEREYGIPFGVAREIDDIFEWLPADKAGEFAVAVIEAIPVGADLSGVVAEVDNAKYSDCETAEIAAALFIADLAATPVPASVA